MVTEKISIKNKSSIFHQNTEHSLRASRAQQDPPICKFKGIKLPRFQKKACESSQYIPKRAMGKVGRGSQNFNGDHRKLEKNT